MPGQISIKIYEDISREIREFEEYKENNKQELIRLYTSEPDNLNNILVHTQFFLINSEHLAYLNLQKTIILQRIFEYR